MIQFVSNFANQLIEAHSIGKNTSLTKADNELRNVIICGLGGSGIGGKIVAQLSQTYSTLPIVTHNDYGLPNFVDQHSLVIISSYSGNTEETISALKKAIERNCEIACITSGGEVLEISKQHGLNNLVVPSGNPPRAMLTYSLVQLIFLFENYGIIAPKSNLQVLDAIQLIVEEEESIKTEAKKIAKEIHNTTPLIYSDASFEGVGTRFKQQLNENSKVLAFNHVVPEMNHNELVGWAGGSENFSVLFLRNESDFERNQLRMEICKKIIQTKTSKVFEIYSKGDSEIEKTLYLIILTDWISVYLAEILEVDPIEVDVITNLKNQLSKQ